jgi:hypothetical protein
MDIVMKYGFFFICSLMAGLCAPVEKPDDTDGTGELPDVCTGGATLADVQKGEYADQEEVEIPCAVVTGELTATGDGFFVQDPGGGEYSGMYVYLYGGMDADELEIEVGDLISLAGVVSEWNDLTEISIATAYDVAVIGEYPVTVDAVDCGTSDWEPWEGCLISIDGLEVTSWPDNYGQVDTSCGITFDDLYFDYNSGSGAVCTPVVGPLTYTYGAYRLVPRDEADMAGCTDPEQVEGSSIAEMKASGAGDGDYVSLEQVVITTELTPDGELFFIQDQGGGVNSGIPVYIGSDSYDAVIGKVIDVEGPLSLYYDLLEIAPTNITDSGSTATPTADTLSADPSDWEDYEGALVTLTDVQITSDPDNYGEVTTNYGVTIDDLFYQADMSSGESYSSVTGVITYSYSAYKLLPRDASDVVE